MNQSHENRSAGFCRRTFLAYTAGWGGLYALSGLLGKTILCAASGNSDVFTPSALVGVGAIVHQIIPRADSASTARFIAEQAGDSPRLQALFRSSLKDLDDASRQKIGGPFASAPEEQQRDLLRSIEKSDFFRTVRNLSIRGFYSSAAGFRSVGYPGPGQPMGHRDFGQEPGTGSVAAPPVDMPNGVGKEELQSQCAQCHDLGVVTAHRRTPEQWRETVEKMRKQYQAKLDAPSAEKIVEYLSQHFGAP